MKLTSELLTKAKETKSAEELQALAKENSIELTAEEAEQYFSTLHPTGGEISDDELDNVSGGGCGEDDEVKNYSIFEYKVGDRVAFLYDFDPNGRIFEGKIIKRYKAHNMTEAPTYTIEFSKDWCTVYRNCEEEYIVRRV